MFFSCPGSEPVGCSAARIGSATGHRYRSPSDPAVQVGGLAKGAGPGPARAPVWFSRGRSGDSVDAASPSARVGVGQQHSAGVPAMEPIAAYKASLQAMLGAVRRTI